MNNKINIPELFAQRTYQPGTEPGEEQIVYRIRWQNIGSLGNFSVITGLPKAGKSRYLSAIMAAGMSREEVFLQSVKLPQGKDHILHIDTEQSKYDYHKMLKFVKRLIQCPASAAFPDNFKSLYCRGIASSTVMGLIQYYLDTTPTCGMIVLDGLLDMIERFNDEGESTKLIKWIEEITDRFNVHIIAVLHRTKSADKAIGHVGSAVERKAQSILIVEKQTEGTAVNYILKPEYLRSAEGFEPVAIYYNKGSEIFELTEIATEDPVRQNNRKRRAREYDISEHMDNTRRIFNAGTVQDYRTVIQNIKEIYGIGDTFAKQDFLPYLIFEGIIFRVDDGYTNVSQARLFIQK